MIEISNKKNCCGCFACVQKCPKQCISLLEDKEGFIYPKVDETICVKCGLCDKVCPVINRDKKREPIVAYAAKNYNETIRRNSSSGGIFTPLAESVINQGGVVFGACFTEKWEVVHDYTETIDGIDRFRGSKYVQSNINQCYSKVESFLKEGRKVLFSGTPCQVAGLRKFLREEYEKLLTVDFICHGVPSPGVFRTFLRDELHKFARQCGQKNTILPPCIPLVSEKDEFAMKGSEIKSISFRDKRNGWKKYGFTLLFSEVSEGKNTILSSYTRVDKHPYMDGFLKDLYLRPSCYACPTKELSSGSDITLGDYWGIENLMPDIDDDKGVSVVTINTLRGKKVIDQIQVELHKVPWTDVVLRNRSIVQSAKIPKNRILFFEDDSKTFNQKIRILCKVPFSLKKVLIHWALKVPKPIRTFGKCILKKMGLKNRIK